jgi:hypothetical protein
MSRGFLRNKPETMTQRILILASLVLAGCASPNIPAPPPADPIMPDDMVKDAATAFKLAEQQCHIHFLQSFDMARLEKDKWELWGEGMEQHSASVAKHDGTVSNCSVINFDPA